MGNEFRGKMSIAAARLLLWRYASPEQEGMTLRRIPRNKIPSILVRYGKLSAREAANTASLVSDSPMASIIWTKFHMVFLQPPPAISRLRAGQSGVARNKRRPPLPLIYGFLRGKWARRYGKSGPWHDAWVVQAPMKYLRRHFSAADPGYLLRALQKLVKLGCLVRMAKEVVPTYRFIMAPSFILLTSEGLNAQ